MKNIRIGGKTIREGYCSCYKAYITDKTFDKHITEVFPNKEDAFAVSLTEDKILYELNKAESWEVVVPEPLNNAKNLNLIIHTPTHKITVVIVENFRKVWKK